VFPKTLSAKAPEVALRSAAVGVSPKSNQPRSLSSEHIDVREIGEMEVNRWVRAFDSPIEIREA
jgi:hypothetical protein